MNDNSWKIIGDQDPYFGVLTHEQFHLDKMTGDKLNLFFQTGYDHIEHVTGKIKMHFNLPENHRFSNALDFGCGTGRLIIPLSKKSERVTGVDISQGMLEKAALHISENGITNITLLQIDDILSYHFEKPFDLVHTFIVLQHINEKLGYGIVKKLVSVVKPAGFGIIHLTFDSALPKKDRFFTRLKRKSRLLNQLFNLLKGRPLNRPFMQMNEYDLKQVLRIFYDDGITDLHIEFTNHDGFIGIIIYFRK